MRFGSDEEAMRHALALARRGFGRVEPNPQVGAVLTTADGRLIADGCHQECGGPHAEVHALRAAAEQARGATLYVTLEPCCHHGRTPPCSDAVLAAGVRRVVVGCVDPAPHVAGRGLQQLRDAGLQVDVGVCRGEAEALIAPFVRLQLQQRPWVHAKWAMTLDGRIAARTGHSQWISGTESRAYVHQLRSCMEAIVTGAGTVRTDNPRLTVRMPTTDGSAFCSGGRTPLRVVLDARGTAVQRGSALITTLPEAPVLVCVGSACAQSECDRLAELGVEVFRAGEGLNGVDLQSVLAELGRRGMTHVLLESGPRLLGSFFDAGLLDELHVFVAPKLVGGAAALSPVGGRGLDEIPGAAVLDRLTWRQLGDDLLLEGPVRR